MPCPIAFYIRYRKMYIRCQLSLFEGCCNYLPIYFLLQVVYRRGREGWQILLYSITVCRKLQDKVYYLGVFYTITIG